MFNCKYCGEESDNDNSFCGNCGNLLSKENENIILSTLRMVGKGVFNPASYIRNSKNVNIVYSGVLCIGLLIIGFVQALFMKISLSSMLPMSYIFKLWGVSILIQALTIGVNIGVCYGVLTLMKRRVDIVECTNIFVFSTFFISIISFIPILFNLVSATLAILFLIVLAALNYGIIYFGLKDSFELSPRDSFMVMISCYVALQVVLSIVLSIII